MVLLNLERNDMRFLARMRSAGGGRFEDCQMISDDAEGKRN